MATKLDANQVLKNSYDEATASLKTIPSSATSFSVELSAADGDSVIIQSLKSSTVVSLTNASTGVVLAEFDCSDLNKFNLYTETTTTIVGAQVCTLELSPADSGDVWVATALTITPSLTDEVVVMGTALSNVLARRARVSIAAAITSGTFNLHLIGQA
jgi:hypothetical protein